MAKRQKATVRERRHLDEDVMTPEQEELVRRRAQMIEDIVEMEVSGVTWPFVRVVLPAMRHQSWNVRSVAKNPVTEAELDRFEEERGFLLTLAEYLRNDDNTLPSDGASVEWYLAKGLPMGKMPTPHDARVLIEGGRDKRAMPELAEVLRRIPSKDWARLGMDENPRWSGVVGKPWREASDGASEETDELLLTELRGLRRSGVSVQTLSRVLHVPPSYVRVPGRLRGTELSANWRGSMGRWALLRLAETLMEVGEGADLEAVDWWAWTRAKPGRTTWPEPLMVAAIERNGNELARVKMTRLLFA